MGTQLPFALLDAPAQGCDFALLWKNKVNIGQVAQHGLHCLLDQH